MMGVPMLLGTSDRYLLAVCSFSLTRILAAGGHCTLYDRHDHSHPTFRRA
jgi:hypothetical protein